MLSWRCAIYGAIARQYLSKIAIFDNWYWVLAYPGIEVSTAEARAILPKSYTRQNVIAHGRHLGGFACLPYPSGKSCRDYDERCHCRALS